MSDAPVIFTGSYAAELRKLAERFKSADEKNQGERLNADQVYSALPIARLVAAMACPPDPDGAEQDRRGVA